MPRKLIAACGLMFGIGLLLQPVSGASQTPLPGLPGDANSDGKVDGLDYVTWLTNYGRTVSGQANGDFNNDNKVDGLDYVTWLNNYGRTVSVPTPTSISGSYSSCLRQTGSLFTITGTQTGQYHTGSNPLPENAKVDARSAVWIQAANYPVVLVGGPNVCFSGGTVTGTYPYSTTWDVMHGTSGSTIRTTGKTTVENVRIHNYGDGIAFTTGEASYSFHMHGVHMTHIRDDCVENDYMYTGLIEDSLFDGCYTAFSAQSYSPEMEKDGSGNIWTIKNSLVRMEPMEKVYADRGLIPGHGSFFKWNKDNDKSPKLALHNNIFRADQPSNSSAGLGLPAGKLASCSDNIMVWLGEANFGNFPDTLPETFNGQKCFTITTDKSVWDNAVADWKSRH